MAGIPQRIPRVINLTASGGSASTVVQFGGEVMGFSVIAPSGSAQWTISFDDEDGYPISKHSNMVGNCPVKDNFQIWFDKARDKGVTVALSNSTDGAYKIKLWFRAA